tara:strand:- start:786 stop:905 length:120 start_codon:yes stop_codon:yes gene_type:complete
MKTKKDIPVMPEWKKKEIEEFNRMCKDNKPEAPTEPPYC